MILRQRKYERNLSCVGEFMISIHHTMSVHCMMHALSIKWQEVYDKANQEPHMFFYISDKIHISKGTFWKKGGKWHSLVNSPFPNLPFHRRESKQELEYCERYQTSNFFSFLYIFYNNLSPLAQKAKLGFKLLLFERLNENLRQNYF